MKHFVILAMLFCGVFAEAQTLNNISSSLTVYVYPPRNRINWSTPKSTANSIINMEVAAALLANEDVEFVSEFGERGTMSSTYRSTMGHTISHIQCILPNGRQYNKWTSFTGQNYGKADRQELIDRKLGAGVLFHEYVDGEVIAGDENPLRLTFYNGEPTYYGDVRPRYLQFEVTAQGCAEIQKMVSFFEGFHHPPMSLDQLEQMPEHQRLFFSAQLDPYATYLERQSNPYSRVGGGCAPYGAALMKIAGRYKPELESFFSRPVTISERLIGGIVDPYTGRIREVSIPEITKGPLGDHWTYQGYNNRYLSLYDPHMIWDFIGNLMQCSAKPGQCNAAVSAWMNTQSGFSRGQQQVFRARYMAVIGPKVGPNGKPTERIEKFAEQPVDGMIWRLGR